MPRVVTLPNGAKKTDERMDSYVSWKIFVWAMGIILMLFGWLINSDILLSNKTSFNRDSFYSIKVDIQELKTNIVWIVEALKKGDTR